MDLLDGPRLRHAPGRDDTGATEGVGGRGHVLSPRSVQWEVVPEYHMGPWARFYQRPGSGLPGRLAARFNGFGWDMGCVVGWDWVGRGRRGGGEWVVEWER